MRAGQFVRQVEGYRAFIPALLPPNPARSGVCVKLIGVWRAGVP